MQQNDELKQLIVSNLDVMEFLDICDLELTDLVMMEEIEYYIEENKAKLEKAVR